MTNEEAKVIAEAAFTLESVAHLRGLEKACLPSADALRGLLPCPDCKSNQRFVRRIGPGGFECENLWHFAGGDANEVRPPCEGIGNSVARPTYEELAELVGWLCVEHEDSLLPITVIARVHAVHERLRKSK